MLVFDTEVFRYNWLFVGLDLDTEEFIIVEDDKSKLFDIYEKYKNDIWVGYNSKNYDKYIVQGILAGINPKVINDWIIQEGKPGWKFSNELREYPINIYDTIIFGKSLKQLESFLGVDIRETEIDFNIDRPLSDTEKESNRKYCMSDVINTARVFFETIDDFKAQLGLIKLSNSPLSDLSKTKAQLSAKMLGAQRLTPKEWEEEWDFEYNECVKSYNYVHSEVINFFDELRKTNDDKAKLEIDLYGVPHVFALGGIHGAINNYMCVPDDSERIAHIDIASYYPHIMTEWGYLSRAVPSVEHFRDIMELRLKYKSEGNPLQAPLKISINGTYGQSGAGKRNDDGTYTVLSDLYDPKRMREVCINGQLMILQLIEDLSGADDEFKLLQANTDGLIYKYPSDKEDKLKAIVSAWEKRSKMTMEYDYTKALYQRDINNYIAVFDTGKIERKGGVVKSSTPIDYDLPVIKDAVTEYFVKGTPVSEFINRQTNLMPFMKTYKVSSAYKGAMYGDKKLDGKVFRVFASKGRNDKCLYKYKEGKNPEKFAGCPLKCRIVNEDIRDSGIPTWLDKNWYIEYAEREIMKFNGENS